MCGNGIHASGANYVILQVRLPADGDARKMWEIIYDG